MITISRDQTIATYARNITTQLQIYCSDASSLKTEISPVGPACYLDDLLYDDQLN